MSKKHTLSVLVENKPSVLARVAGLFARRAFNIDSLAVGPTEDPALSRMTIVVDVKRLPLEQVTKQLNKLINVIRIEELAPGESVQRQLLFVKVRADDSTRANVLQIVSMFRARVIDVAVTTVTIESTGGDDKQNALLAALAPYGIKEIVRSGTVAIGRGEESVSEQASQEWHAVVDSGDDADAYSEFLSDPQAQV
ncbi:MAG: acetolactate synthase small subunit [Actinomycetaceae bacterium]|nr:acetolactate synthase small subunit [Arcanobacterium sp.]MDD7505700.1 acetolactate synthase small subunit [Actinomycetaceae bacterium]MDY6143696.1 acetolactate synthase small subunit [Arcanobacterium sp.]